MDREYTLGDLAARLGVELRGDAACRIKRLNTLQGAGEGDLAFLANKVYEDFLASTGASAVILKPADADKFAGNRLVVSNPYLAYARATALFDTTPQMPAGIHPSAVVADSARIAKDVAIGPHATIGEGVRIDARASIGAGAFIGDHCVIGSDTRVFANVSIYHGVSIGRQVVIHSGAVIGADGFGFAHDGEHWVKIRQLGGVQIGDNVEIGACTTIDRGALGDTVIESGAILDNHVQIAHNVHLGENTAMAAYSAIAGSSVIGKNCLFAGQAGAVGHVTVCDNVQVMARCSISKSVTKAGSYSSGLLMYETPDWRRNAARFGQLDDMYRRLRKLEKISNPNDLRDDVQLRNPDGN